MTSGHVASDPRSVKFADALYGEGYRTSVVAADITPQVRPLDRAVMATRGWTLVRVPRGPALSWASSGLAARAARRAWKAGLRHPSLPRQALGRLAPRLAAAAVAQEADLYIGVNLDGGVAARAAAAATGAALAFDAVDDHPGEIPDADSRSPEVSLRQAFLAELASRCRLRFTSSRMIADALRARTSFEWQVLRNVFPRDDASGLEGPIDATAPTIYWFSQTIGPGRGIEPLLAAMARSRHRWRIDLRGTPASGFEASLTRVAAAHGLAAEQLRWLAPAEPGAMTRLAAGYALGASVEVNDSPNRRHCLGNKVFQYLLAGTPVLLSSTPAQRALADEVGEACLLVDLEQPGVAAKALDDWWEDATRRRRAQQSAWQVAHATLNWDAEKAAFLAAVRDVIGPAQVAPGAGSAP